MSIFNIKISILYAWHELLNTLKKGISPCNYFVPNKHGLYRQKYTGTVRTLNMVCAMPITILLYLIYFLAHHYLCPKWVSEFVSCVCYNYCHTVSESVLYTVTKYVNERFQFILASIWAYLTDRSFSELRKCDTASCHRNFNFEIIVVRLLFVGTESRWTSAK